MNFTITATVCINWPRPRFKTFDVEMTLSISNMFGKVEKRRNIIFFFLCLLTIQQG